MDMTVLKKDFFIFCFILIIACGKMYQITDHAAKQIRAILVLERSPVDVTDHRCGMWLVCEAVHDGRVIMCAGSKRPSMPNAQAVMAVDGYHDATEILVSVGRLHPSCLQCLQLTTCPRPAPCYDHNTGAVIVCQNTPH